MGYSAESSDTDQFCSQNDKDTLKTDSQVQVTPVAQSSLEYKYPCEKCGVVFKRKDSYDRHEFKHNGVKNFMCQQLGCDKSYSNNSHLKRHSRSHAKREEMTMKTIKCTVDTCSGLFKNHETLRKHMLTHINEKPYKCGQCELTFKRKLQLKQHLYQHTGEYPYKCPECEKGFVNLKAFRNHKTSHLIKLHRCVACSKDFSKWSDLVSHRKIEHISEYQCRVCLKIFYSKQNLHQHQKIHAPKDEQKVFQCPHDRCPKYYFHEKNLKVHIRAKHEGKKFECAMCHRQVLTKQKLLQHVKLHISALNNVRKAKSRRNSTAKTRCDAGIPKTSAASLLAGFELNVEANRLLIAGKSEFVLVEPSELPSVVVGRDDISATDTEAETTI